jgi:hypothetical protein
MGQVLSGGSSRPITAEELQSIETLRQSIAQMPVPVLQRRDNPQGMLPSHGTPYHRHPD